MRMGDWEVISETGGGTATLVSLSMACRWGEGTQIEPADDYGATAGSNMTYMNLTREWSERFRESASSRGGDNTEL